MHPDIIVKRQHQLLRLSTPGGPCAGWTTGPPSGRPGMTALGFARGRIAQHKEARQTERIGGRSRVVVRNAG